MADTTTNTGWIDQASGKYCADPFNCPGHHDDDTSAGVDLIGPNMAAINLTARLRDVTFAQQWADSLREWRDALDRAIDRENHESTMWLSMLKDHLTGNRPSDPELMTEAREHMARMHDLYRRREIATHMLGDAEHQPYS